MVNFSYLQKGLIKLDTVSAKKTKTFLKKPIPSVSCALKYMTIMCHVMNSTINRVKRGPRKKMTTFVCRVEDFTEELILKDH